MPSTDGPSELATSGSRPSIGGRIGLAMGAVAFIAVLITGAVAVPLVSRNVTGLQRQQLAASANLVAHFIENSRRPVDPTDPLQSRGGVQELLTKQHIQLIAGSGLTASLNQADRSALAAGGQVSGTRTINGKRVLVEGRPVSGGVGIALVEPLSVITSPGHGEARRLALALAIGLVVAASAGVALSWRLAQPLRRAAAAAGELAAGHREVRVEPQGPAEVAAVAEAINELAAALQHSEGRQREFLLSISHELRTPLTAVRGYAEALSDGVVPTDRTAATGATILAEAHRLNRLVEDLLDLARLGADTFPLDLTDTDLAEVLAAAGQVWRDRAASTGVTVRQNLLASPLLVRTDPVRVRQIVDGLAENALRMLNSGGVLVLELRAEPGWAVLEVRDSGPGLTDTDIAVAFERSALHDRYRGERRVGAGVGLALIEGLARRLGGSATAGHAAEGGATFTIRLPRPGDPYATRTSL